MYNLKENLNTENLNTEYLNTENLDKKDFNDILDKLGEILKDDKTIDY